MALFNIPRTKHDSYHWYSSLSQLETLVAWIPIYLIFYLGQSSCLQDIRYLSRISLPVFCLHKYYISWQYTERQLWFWGFLFVCIPKSQRQSGRKHKSLQSKGSEKFPKTLPRNWPLNNLPQYLECLPFKQLGLREKAHYKIPEDGKRGKGKRWNKTADSTHAGQFPPRV